MEKILLDWLGYQCKILSGTICAQLITGPPGQGPYDQIMYWPKEKKDHTEPSRAIRAALHNQKPVIETRNRVVEGTGEPIDALACPIFLDGRLFGCVAIEITNRSQTMQQAAVKQVQAGAKWLESMLLLHGASVKDREKLINIVELLSVGLDHETFQVAVAAVANELAERFACHRVSLGFLRYNRLRIEAISHSTRFDVDSSMVRAIQEAMNESLDQGITVVYPIESNEKVLVSQFHAQLAKMQQNESICTVPLIKNGKAFGALLLERSVDNPFENETVSQCDQISLLLGSVLETRRREEQPLPYQIIDSVSGWLGKLFGPRHLTLKMGATALVILVLWLSLAGSMFRISADSVLEANICRSIVSPQQGYIAEAHARAGDLVKKGDLLATLDDKELLLEKRKWQSQLTQLVKEYRKALAGADRTEVAILNAKRSQAEAQLKLVEQQLARTTLMAPFSGLVVKGDLSQALGSPVERGDVLYEVAPTDEYRVILKVDDRDIGLVALAQQGQLKLSGIPEKAFNIAIDRLTPVSSADDGINYFRVEAMMEAHSDLMRPGMEGIAKIEVGRKKLIWIWTRRLLDWFRLFCWNWLP